MYTKIINPETSRKVNINSKLGKSILKKYIKQFYGGSSNERNDTVSDSQSVLHLPQLRVGKYELVQKTCFLKDNFSQQQLVKFFNDDLEIYLKNISLENYNINIIGSPSENAIVFKLKFNAITSQKKPVIQCYALKIMPELDGNDNETELFFAEYLSNLNSNLFPQMYYKKKIAFNLSDIKLDEDSSIKSIFSLNIRNWYNKTTYMEKFTKHADLYRKILESNGDKITFSCDVLVSRMYWGDMLAFSGPSIPHLEAEVGVESKEPELLLPSDIKECPLSNTLTRCKQLDFNGMLQNIKNNVPEMKILLTKILLSIKFLREHNIIHNDLHLSLIHI